ncbi:hypothetical protein BN871_CF_00230, partial [Paenibacillus sp. P22]
STKHLIAGKRRGIVLEPGQNFHDLGESYKQTYSNPGRTQNTVYLRLDYNAPCGTVLNVKKINVDTSKL